MKEHRTIGIDISISNEELYIPIIDLSNTSIISDDIHVLISEHESLKKPSITDISKVLEELAQKLFKTSEFDLFTITDVYSIDALKDLNQLVSHYKKAYLTKILDDPFDYTFYLLCFDKINDDEHERSINNLDKLRSFIYLVVANAEVAKRLV